MRMTKRSQARAIYLAHFGAITFSELAKTVGCNRSTVSRWARADDWDAEVEKIKTNSACRLAEHFSDGIANLLEADLGRLEKIGELIDSRLEGAKTMASSEIKQLIDAVAQKVRALRLLAGQSTSNTAVAVREERPANDVPQPKSNFEKRVEDIARTGDPEAQKALMAIAENFSKLDAPLEG